LGDLGAHPWIASGQCQKFQQLVAIYTRLSQKKGKSKATRQKAAQMAQDAKRNYQACVEAKKITTHVDPHPPPHVDPVYPPPVTHPIPWAPYPGGGGGWGGTPVAVPPIEQPVEPPIMSICMDASGRHVPCVSVPQEYVPIEGISGPQGQQVFRSMDNRLFYFDASGQRVYQPWDQPVTPPVTGGPATWGQIPGGDEAPGDAEILTPFPAPPTGAPPITTPTPSAPTVPGRWGTMPGGTPTGDVINEIDLLGQRNIEYQDRWGTIRVLRLVIPKGKAEKLKAKPAAASGGALPGGVMDVNLFTSDYVLS
jgi:hypothetical protein